MPILTCAGLSKSFGGTKALDGVDLTLEPGRIVGLLGPNGSGKTTLLKLANGLLRPSAGKILIDGKEPGVETKKIVSYLPDRACVPDYMTGAQLMAFYGDFYSDFDASAAKAMMERFEIDGRAKIKHMSKGTREKLQLIAVMSRRARLYLLDEPIGGVDPAARDVILGTIIANYDPSATVLISTHLIADVERVLDDILFLKSGKIVLAAPAEELREKHGKSVDEIFREVFRC